VDHVDEQEELNFQESLERLVNRFSVENESNTPDFILAEYIRGCLDSWNAAVKSRDAWYGFKPWQHSSLESKRE